MTAADPGPVGDPFAEQPFRHLIIRWCRGRGVHIGCGDRKAYPSMIGVDPRGANDGRATDIMAEPDDLSFFADESLDYVYATYCLGEDAGPRLAEWWRVLKRNGHLLVEADRKLDAAETREAWPRGYEKIMERGDGPSLQVWRKRNDFMFSETPPPRPPKACLLIRYGGFGDMIFASSVLPGLKEQGFHITVQTTESGRNILKNDPHIDDWWLQDRNIVPNNELGWFWHRLQGEYDRIVNLSESIEGTLLAMEGRFNFYWPDEARRAIMGRTGYLQRTHELAAVPPPFRSRFYPTRTEIQAAKARRALYRGPVVLWVLAGSSVHKAWPYTDEAVHRLLEETDAHICFSGDEWCELLEIGWQNHSRVHVAEKGRDIRETLTFAEEVDVVVGPETGVMNSVAFRDVGKVILLSHSSEENAVEGWVNTTVLKPTSPCYPCHKLHYGFRTCVRDAQTGGAACAASVTVASMVDAIKGRLDGLLDSGSGEKRLRLHS